MKILHMVTWLLLVMGGLNWLLVGLGSAWTLETLVGLSVAKVIFVLVGLSAIYELVTHKKGCRTCSYSNAVMM